MVYYLKANRLVDYSLRDLQHWVNILSLTEDPRVYIVCDNETLRERIEKELDFNGLAVEIMKSIRRECDQELIGRMAVPVWQNLTRAHLTAFIHAREHGYPRFWNIDADDTVFCLGPERAAELLDTAAGYADEHHIDLFSLDMWRSRIANGNGKKLWTFGIVYVNGDVDWLETARRNSDYSPRSYFGYGDRPVLIDEFFTFVRENDKTVSIETFCFKNLTFIHYADDLLRFPYHSGLYHWTDSELILPLHYYIFKCASQGKIPIAEDVIKLDIGIEEREGTNFLAEMGGLTGEVEFKADFEAKIGKQIRRHIDCYASDIRGSSRVYVWGCGGFLKEVVDQLARSQIKLDGIVDNDIRKHGKIFEGLKVFSPDILNDGVGKVTILPIIRAFDEVEAQLKNMDFKGSVFKIVDYSLSNRI